MLVPKSLSKRKLGVLVALLVVAVVGVIYIVYVNFLSTPPADQGTSAAGPTIEFKVQLPEPPLFQRDFFSSTQVRQLHNYGSLPLTAPDPLPGNPNPFPAPAPQALGR